MALSEPPAVIPAAIPASADASPVATLDGAVIRLRIGETTYGIPLRDLGEQLNTHMPAFVTGEGDLSGKEQAFRSVIKGIIPMGLRLLATDVQKISAALEAQGAAPLPLPDLKSRHRDLLDYAVRYLAALILMLMATQTWEAAIGETVEGPNGYVRLAGLSGGVAPMGEPEGGSDGPDAA